MITDPDVLLALFVGLLLGAALGLLLARSRSASTVATLRAEVEHLRTRSDDERSRDAESAAAFERAAGRALAENSDHFLSTASRPLLDQVRRVEEHLAVLERSRTSTDAALAEQVRAMGSSAENLRTETSNLVTALRAPQVRGRWGEMQLRRVVEAAGMVEHVDFSEQVSVRDDASGTDGATATDRTLRPDLVVHLHGGRRVVVDAKVAVGGYLDAINATDEATRSARMTAHARQLRQHVDQLGAKRYWARLSPTPEFVVLFVPAESLLAAALDQDPGLYEHAFARDVVIATPSTLVALLRTVAYSWRQARLSEDAATVLALGRELHERLGTLGEHVGKLGRGLDGTVRAYNQAVASLESRVLVTARRFTDLGLATSELTPSEPVERTPRLLQAPELQDEAATAAPERGAEAPELSAEMVPERPWRRREHAGPDTDEQVG